MGKGKEKGSYHAACPLLSLGMERAQVTDYLIGVDHRIPDWLIKITFLGEVRATIRSGISTSDTILGLWFSL